jgi:integrase
MSVYKRGATWTYHAHWTDDHGVQRQAKRGGYRTKVEAERAKALHVASVAHGTYVPRTGLTVGEYLTDQWLPSRTGKVKPSTLATDGYLVDAYVLPALGRLELAKLDTATLDAFYAQLLRTGRRGVTGAAGSPLSAKSVRNVSGLVHKAMRDAARWGLVAHNPAAEAEPPAPVHREMRHWTPEQLRVFVGHLTGDRLYAVWLLLATTGMRRGEVLGLRWSDVELDGARVSIASTRVAAGAKVVTGSPKTARGRRTISLDATTVSALREFRRLRMAETLSLGLGWDADGLVAAHPDGTAIYPKTFTRTFNRHVAAARLPAIRLHDLRHTYATAALQVARVPVKVVSQRIGHANVSVTLNTYAHVLPGEDEAAADLTASVILGAGS